MSQYYSWPTADHAGLWRLDNNANDSGPNALDGTATGVSYVYGKFDRCGSFVAGSRSRIAIAAATAPPASMQVSDFTIMMWYKGTDTAARSVLFGASAVYVGTNYQYAGYRIDTIAGKLQHWLGNGGLTAETLTGSAINDGIWHHIAATRDADFARLYIDGKKDAEAEDPIEPTFGNSSYYRYTGMGAAYVPGYTPLSLGYFPTCQMDDVQFFNRALTENEIYKLYSYWIGAD